MLENFSESEKCSCCETVYLESCTFMRLGKHDPQTRENNRYNVTRRIIVIEWPHDPRIVMAAEK